MRTPETAFGQQLRRLRLRAGLSQEALAERAGLAPRAIAALESGARRSPYARTLGMPAEALGLSTAERAALADSAERSGRGRDHASVLTPGLAKAVQTPRLPVWLTSFVGREGELETVRALLDAAGSGVRLLTLLGPGGVGKTRLAVAAAAAVAPAFPDGVLFVDLAPLRDARLVPAAVTRALEVPESGGRGARELLLEHLRERQLLLLLDNFEHLLEAAPLVSELLQRCPRVTVLATSRAALRVQGERRVLVAPLAVPAELSSDSTATIQASPAVRLFLDRAQAVVAAFELTDADAAPVAEICRRLDGVPLALELAAARVPLLAPQALLRRLERRLALLTGGAVDLPDRQQTLRQTLAWSYDLLSPADQILFRRLAVFVGGWTLQAAEAVCGDALLPGQAVLDRLLVLVDSSLVHVRPAEQASNEPRFDMLETVREYAMEQLVCSRELERLRRCHAEFYSRLADPSAAVQTNWLWHGALTDQALTVLEAELDNVYAALDWRLANSQAAEGLRLAIALSPLWTRRGHYATGRR